MLYENYWVKVTVDEEKVKADGKDVATVKNKVKEIMNAHNLFSDDGEKYTIDAMLDEAEAVDEAYDDFCEAGLKNCLKLVDSTGTDLTEEFKEYGVD